MITINNIEVEQNFDYLIFLGDIHTDWIVIQKFLKTHGLRNVCIFQVGDFGIGLNKFEKEQRSLSELNKALQKRNSKVFAIRGNHDRPAFFENDPFQLSNILFIPDYSIVSIKVLQEKKKIFCLGGAISIDRMANTEGIDWFPDEVIKDTSDMSILNQIKDIDIMITHTSPEFVPPFVMGSLVHTFAQNDPYLKLELMRERQLLGNMVDYIIKVNPTLKHYFYGHFHMNSMSEYRGVQFECLSIKQFKEVL